MVIESVGLNNDGICDLCKERKRVLQFNLIFDVRLEDIERTIEVCKDCLDAKFKNPDYTINKL